MYQLSNYSGKIKNTITNEVFFKDDRNENTILLLEWQLNEENEIEIVDSFEEEIQQKNLKIYLSKIQTIFAENRFKAECMAVDKNGDSDYIKAQRESYERKYKVAIGETVNTSILAAITKEAEDLGIDLETLKSVIIQKYDDASEVYWGQISLNESCRTRITTHVENNRLQNADDCLAIYPNIICEDYETIVNQLMAI